MTRTGARERCRRCSPAPARSRQYALSIPNELLEAARIDGASELRIFGSVVLPALKPIIVTLAVFTLLGTWNDFM
ncbi:MAG: carbohydrate ABC transporter permease, partial [Betaproteobacteria bacterium]